MHCLAETRSTVTCSRNGYRTASLPFTTKISTHVTAKAQDASYAPALAGKGLDATSGRSAVIVKAAAAAPANPKGSGVSSTTANGVQRINIGVFGVMNAGKSSLINSLAQQEASIVDSTPGTTADVKAVLLELHDLGPAKLLDTAGLDEEGVLGDKKRRTALNCLKECDVAVVVVDTDRMARARSQPGYSVAAALEWEIKVVADSVKYGVSPILLLNVKPSSADGSRPSAAEVESLMAEVHAALDAEKKLPTLALDLAGTSLDERATATANFVKLGALCSSRWGQPHPGCLPRWALGRGAMIMLVIPMEEEMKLLQPQSMVQEEAIRQWATVTCYRLDWKAARGRLGVEPQKAEKLRFERAVQRLRDNKDGPVLMVTDSQVVDLIHRWTLDAATGEPLVPFTTFSICMGYMMSGGRLDKWIGGLEALSELQAGGRVLISEACDCENIPPECDRVGAMQIPKKLNKLFAGKDIQIDHAYARAFPEMDPGPEKPYTVAIHCGGCKIDPFRMGQRLADLNAANVPVTNYGMFLSYAAAPDCRSALRRALDPWGIEPPHMFPSAPPSYASVDFVPMEATTQLMEGAK